MSDQLASTPHGFTADPSVGVTDNFLIGLRINDTEGKIELSGEGLPYMVPDEPYVALMEIKGVKGSTTKMPHPEQIAEILAGLDAPSEMSLTAAQYIAATNPLRRGLRMEPTQAVIGYVQAMEAALTEAGIKWDMYPWALLFGQTPVGDVKARIGESFQMGGPIIVGVGGGKVDVSGDTRPGTG